MIRATVTQASPLRVKVDGAASDSPGTLLGGTPPVLGARVYVYPNTNPLLVQASVVLTGYVTYADLGAETARAEAAEAAATAASSFATLVKMGVDYT